jgi:hypothetical protein
MRLVLLAAVLMLVSIRAYAYEPLPGNRAYPIVGRDIVTGETRSLDDYLGKWVLLEFWASW